MHVGFHIYHRNHRSIGCLKCFTRRAGMWHLCRRKNIICVCVLNCRYIQALIKWQLPSDNVRLSVYIIYALTQYSPHYAELKDDALHISRSFTTFFFTALHCFPYLMLLVWFEFPLLCPEFTTLLNLLLLIYMFLYHWSVSLLSASFKNSGKTAHELGSSAYTTNSTYRRIGNLLYLNTLMYNPKANTVPHLAQG